MIMNDNMLKLKYKTMEALKEDDKIICPECMKETTQSELAMFGGLCEECSLEDKK